MKAYTELALQSEDEAAWKAARWTGITASIVGNILRKPEDKPGNPVAINPYEKRDLDHLLRDYANKVDPVAAVPAMWWGQCMERHILDKAGDLFYDGAKPESWGACCRSTKYPWLLATPDASHNGHLIEIKCVGVYSAKKWTHVPPDYVLAQVYTQLIVTDYPLAHVVMAEHNKWPRLFVVNRDERVERLIINKTKEAWAKVQEYRGEL